MDVDGRFPNWLFTVLAIMNKDEYHSLCKSLSAKLHRGGVARLLGRATHGMFVSSHPQFKKTLIPIVMVLGGGALGGN